MESTKQIRSIRSIRGQKNKRLTEREAWLTLKMGVSGVSSVPHSYSLPFREGPGVGFSPHQVRSVANLISYRRLV